MCSARWSGILSIGLILCFWSAASVDAADQTERLSTPPAVLLDAKEYFGSGATLSYENAAILVRAAFPKQDTTSDDFYCVIHVLQWGDDTSTIEQSHWYLYRGRGTRSSYGGRWTAARFEESRIFGTDRLALLYVHLNVPAVAKVAAQKELDTQLAGGVPKPTGEGNFTRAELLPDKGDASIDLKSARGEPLRVTGDYVVEATYTNISYQIDVVKKLPAPIQNLQDALGILQAQTASAPFVTLSDRVALYARNVYDIRHVPSDITISGKLTTAAALAKTVDLGRQTYDNEGLYYWDISLGIPVQSMSQLEFETSGGQVFAKEVDTMQLLMMANIYWWPVDTKNTKLLLLPRPVVGVALDKKPLKKILVGLSVGLNKVQVYGGRLWSQVDKAPTPDGSATPPTEDTTEYKSDWTFGINASVRQVIDFLKAKK
jgi:hypothetical protein